MSRRHRIKIEDEIRRRTQGPRDKGNDFVTQVQTMYRHFDNVPEEDQLERIFENLRLKYRMYIRRMDFRTLNELVALIEQFEELTREHPKTSSHVMCNESIQGNTQPTLKPTLPSAPSPPPRPNTSANPFRTNTRTYNRETDCWRCGQNGHFRQSCPNARVLFCSQCGTHGNGRNCPCLSENEQMGPTTE